MIPWEHHIFSRHLANDSNIAGHTSHIYPPVPGRSSQHRGWAWNFSCVVYTPNSHANEGGCGQVPRLSHQISPVSKVPRVPSKMKVDVAKCHTCHAEWRWMSLSATPATQSAGATQAPSATQSAAAAAPKRASRASPVPKVKRLPCKMKVDVAKCHACQAKWRWMLLSATLATQNAAATRTLTAPKRATRAIPVP